MSRPIGPYRRPARPRGFLAELAHQPRAARRRAEQPDVGIRLVRGERGEISLIREQVMTHDDRRVVVRGCKFARAARAAGLQRDALCARKALGNRIGRAMIEHRDVPVHQAGDFDQRHRIRAGAEHEQARRQFDRRDQERRAVARRRVVGCDADLAGRVQHVGDRLLRSARRALRSSGPESCVRADSAAFVRLRDQREAAGDVDRAGTLR